MRMMLVYENTMPLTPINLSLDAKEYRELKSKLILKNKTFSQWVRDMVKRELRKK